MIEAQTPSYSLPKPRGKQATPGQSIPLPRIGKNLTRKGLHRSATSCVKRPPQSGAHHSPTLRNHDLSPTLMLHTFGASGRFGGCSVWLLTACLAAIAITPDLSGQRSRSPRGKTTALKVGTVHPVSGPAIKNAVVLIQGGRITAVGAADTVKIPPKAEVLEYPQAHAYPGLVDAMSTAYIDAKDLGLAETGAGSPIADGLTQYHKASEHLVESGVTTVYVASRSSRSWRGIGTVIHPGTKGYRAMRKSPGAVHMRISASGHPLSRLKALESVQKSFDGLDKYEESFEKYEKDKKKYDEDFEKYLEYHRKKNNKPDPKKETAKNKKATKKPASKSTKKDKAKPGEKPAPKKEKGEKKKKPAPKKEPAPKKKPTTKPAKAPSKQDPKSKTSAKGSPAKKDSKADGKEPKRPKAPKEPKKDKNKDALIAVRDGERALHIEVHKIDEIRAALELARSAKIKTVVLEQASDGAELADAIARAGSFVVLTDVAARAGRTLDEDRDGSLAAKLHGAGVPIAIGSGGMGRASHLTLLAAQAAGHGLGVDAAVTAITLNPARILGIAEQVGSLEPHKRADILITSAPLLQSDSRILRVLSAGLTAFEASR